MTQRKINIGTSAGAGDGDDLRTSFDKVNQNFDDIFGGNVIAANVLVYSVAGRQGNIQLTWQDVAGVATTGDITGVQQNITAATADAYAYTDYAVAHLGPLPDINVTGGSIGNVHITGTSWGTVTNLAVTDSIVTGGAVQVGTDLVVVGSISSQNDILVRGTLRFNDGSLMVTAPVPQSLTPVYNSIALVNANVTAANTAILALQGNAATQEVEIRGLRANITAANAQVTALFSNAATQQVSINYLLANASIQQATLTVLTGNAAGQAIAINRVNANVTAANVTISNNSADITVLQANAAFQETEIRGLRANITAANAAITAFNNTAIAQINANVAAANVHIAALEAGQTSANLTITGLTANTGQLAADIQVLFSNAATQSLQIAVLSSNAATQGRYINAINANVAAANAAILSLSAVDTNAISANIAAANINIAQNSASITAANLEIIRTIGRVTAANAQIALRANLANPVFTGVVTAANVFAANATIGNIVVRDLNTTNLGGTLLTAAQPNITTVGTLSTVTVSGTATVGQLYATGIHGSLLTAAQPNITSVGQLTQLNVIANVVAGNLVGTQVTTTRGVISTVTAVDVIVAGNVTSPGLNITSNAAIGNITSAGTITANDLIGSRVTGTLLTHAQPNVTSLGLLTNVSVIGNTVTGNIVVGNTVSATNVAAIRVVADTVTGTLLTNAQPYINQTGNLGYLNVDGDLVVTGNLRAGGRNAAITVTNLTANVITANYVIAGNLTGTIRTAAQPNITSVGTLSALAVTGTATAGAFTTTGTVTAATIAANLTASSAAVTGNITANNMNITYNVSAGNITAANIQMSGQLVTNKMYATTAQFQTVDGTLLQGVQTNITQVGPLSGLYVTGQSYLAANVNIASDLFVDGNLHVSGNTTQVNATQITTQDKDIILATGSYNSFMARGAGILVGDAAGTYGNLTIYDGKWKTPNSIATLGNLNAANVNAVQGTFTNIAGQLITSSQPNVTTVGTLGSLTVTGNVNSGNVVTTQVTLGTVLQFGDGTIQYTAAANAGITAANLSAINANVTAANAEIGKLQANITAANSAISTLDANLGTVTLTTIPGVQANVTAANIEIGNLQSNITAANSAISTLDANLGTVTLTTIPGVQANVTAANVEISNLQANVTAANVEISNLQGNVTAANIEIGNLQANITAANSAISGKSNTNNPVFTGQVIAADITATGNILAGNITANNTLSAASIAGTIITAAQPNITSIGTLSTLQTTTANIDTSANIGTDLRVDGYANLSMINTNHLSATLIAGQLDTGAQPGITAVGTLTSLSVTGNVVTGNVSGSTGNFAYITGVLQTSAQPNITSVGSLSSLVITGNLQSANVITGNISVTGNISGTMLTSAQPYVTSLGVLTTLTVVTSNVTGDSSVNGNLTANGNVTLQGKLTAGNVISNSAVQAVTVTTTGNITSANVTTGNIYATGNVVGNANAVFGANVDSFSSNTGAMVIIGGAGITKNLYVGGATVLQSNAVVTANLQINPGTNKDNALVVLGDISLNGPGARSLKSNVSTIEIFPTGVTTIDMGGEATQINLGSTSGTGNLFVRSYLNLAANIQNANPGNIAIVSDGTVITGNGYVRGDITIGANVNALGNLNTLSSSYVTGNINVASNANVTGNANITSNVNVVGNVNVASNVNVLSNLNVTANSYIAGNVNVSSNVYIASTYNARNTKSGALQVQGGAAIVGNIVTTGTTANVYSFTPTITANTGALVVQGGVSVGGNLFVVGDLTSQGNVTFAAFIANSVNAPIGDSTPNRATFTTVSIAAGNLRPQRTPTMNFDFSNGRRLDPKLSFNRESQATYVDFRGNLSLASNGAPRFTYDPVSLLPRGIVIEESRQNLYVQSNSFANTLVYSTNAATVTAAPSTVNAPTGAAEAFLLREDSTNDYHYMGRVYPSVYIPTITLGATYTASIFVKSAGTTQVSLFSYSEASGQAPIFDISTGSIINEPAGYACSITDYANGWYKISSTVVKTNTNGSWYVALAQTGSVQYLGNSSNGIYLYGLQVELGSFATSYIPTTTVANIRLADDLWVTSDSITRNRSFNPQAGTVFVDAQLSYRPTSLVPENLRSTLISFHSGASNGNDRVSIVVENHASPTIYRGANLIVVSDGVLKTNLVIATSNVNTTSSGKISAYFANASVGAVLDAGNVITATTPVLTNLGNVFIGSGVATGYLNGTVKKVQYYIGTSVAGEIQALTTR